MDIKHRMQRWFKPRFAVLYPFGILFLFLGNPDDVSLKISIGWIIAGLFMRIWSNGYAIKMGKLTTSGPYMFIRNPLYFGTLLLAVGFNILLKTNILGVVFIVVMAFVYYRTIKQEEQMLEARFGEAFRAYMKKVPAMVPTLFPYKAGEKWPFSLKRLSESKEYKTFLWSMILVIVFYVKAKLFVEHESMNPRIASLIGLAFFLSLIDLAGEAVKAMRKRSGEINSLTK